MADRRRIGGAGAVRHHRRGGDDAEGRTLSRRAHLRRSGAGPGARARGRGLERHPRRDRQRSEEHTSELQSLMRISYAVFCLKKKKTQHFTTIHIYKSAKSTRIQISPLEESKDQL